MYLGLKKTISLSKKKLKNITIGCLMKGYFSQFIKYKQQFVLASDSVL